MTSNRWVRKGYFTLFFEFARDVSIYGDMIVNGKKIGTIEPCFVDDVEMARLILSGVSIDEFAKENDGDSREGNQSTDDIRANYTLPDW